MDSLPTGPVRITLIHNEPSCRKCRETKAILDAVVAESAGCCVLDTLTLAEAYEAGLGAVLTPTVLLDGRVLCAGIVPRKDGVLRVLRRYPSLL